MVLLLSIIFIVLWAQVANTERQSVIVSLFDPNKPSIVIIPGTKPMVFGSRAAAGGDTSLGGWYATCFLMNVTVKSTLFQVMLDTGSTTFTIPSANLNDYSGPTLNQQRPQNALDASGHYGDGSWWQGYGIQLNVTLTGTNITAANAPVAVITSQSSSPVFIPGGIPSEIRARNGLLGLAYSPLTSLSLSPPSVVDAWYNAGTMSNNAISFFACPAKRLSEAWIDFGNENPSKACNPSGIPLVYTPIPVKSYYTVDVTGFLVDGVSITRPASFQTQGGNLIGFGEKAWSIWDSCSTLIKVPSSIKMALTDKIKNSGVLSFLGDYQDTFLNNGIMFKYASMNYAAFPNFTIELNTEIRRSDNQGNQTVQLTLMGNHYIQEDPDGFLTFLIGSGDDRYSILGLPMYTAFNLVKDRTNARVGIAPGCGCTDTLSMIPRIVRVDGEVKYTLFPATSTISSFTSSSTISQSTPSPSPTVRPSSTRATAVSTSPTASIMPSSSSSLSSRNTISTGSTTAIISATRSLSTTFGSTTIVGVPTTTSSSARSLTSSTIVSTSSSSPSSIRNTISTGSTTSIISKTESSSPTFNSTIVGVPTSTFASLFSSPASGPTSSSTPYIITPSLSFKSSGGSLVSSNTLTMFPTTISTSIASTPITIIRTSLVTTSRISDYSYPTLINQTKSLFSPSSQVSGSMVTSSINTQPTTTSASLSPQMQNHVMLGIVLSSSLLMIFI